MSTGNHTLGKLVIGGVGLLGLIFGASLVAYHWRRDPTQGHVHVADGRGIYRS